MYCFKTPSDHTFATFALHELVAFYKKSMQKASSIPDLNFIRRQRCCVTVQTHRRRSDRLSKFCAVGRSQPPSPSLACHNVIVFPYSAIQTFAANTVGGKVPAVT